MTTPSDREVLASKLELLIDFYEQKHGAQLRHPEVAAALEAEGITLTRIRWYRLRQGTAAWDPDLLKALSRFFGVPEGYLLQRDEQLPDKIRAQMNVFLALRAAEANTLAARVIGEVTPEALNELAAVLAKHRRQHP
ncbi:hypothetical protein [Sinomonas mesophila]|uniref:hypothetical protein n=1 Tax=Sinomonas mesophila TaxID=1531955 RepID=UPI0011156566|nr:hypothetical protein [Sinomonas mesophila]